MPVTDNPTISTAPDNAERSAHREAFPRRGAVMVVAVPAAGAVLTIDMAAIGLAGRHVRLRVQATSPIAYFFEARSEATPPVQTIPDSTALATFNAAGVRLTNPATQATVIPVLGEARRFCSAKFPILRVNGVGGVSVLEIEDATI